eukprot:253253_1
MGNENSPQNVTNEDPNSHGSQSNHQRPRGPRLYDKLTNKTYEEFFINHHKLYQLSNINDVSLLNPKRIVFLSIRDLYKSWKRCPSISLYNALIIMPLKLKWILSPDKHTRHPYAELLKDNDFWTLLCWKHHQKLAIFLLDQEWIDEDDRKMTETQQTHGHTKGEEDTKSTSPVWHRLSHLLTHLHDPMSANGKYNPLMISESYWRRKSSLCALINSQKEIDEVLLELYTVTMRFKAMQNIINESNNATLNVMINFVDEKVFCKSKTVPARDDDLDDSILDQTWWIADDYGDELDDIEAILQFEEFVNTSDNNNGTQNDHDPDDDAVAVVAVSGRLSK